MSDLTVSLSVMSDLFDFDKIPPTMLGTFSRNFFIELFRCDPDQALKVLLRIMDRDMMKFVSEMSYFPRIEYKEDHLIFTFTNVDEAILFKLTWGGS